MKTKKTNVSILHEAKTSPDEIQNLYMDYGHEWVYHKGVFVSRKYDAAHFEILSPNEHRLRVTLVVLGIFRLSFHQVISVIPHKRITSEGKDIFGNNLSSVWELKEMENGITQVHASYVIELPWFMGFMSLPLSWFLKEMRIKSWKKDRTMLERRSALLNLGFGDGGRHPNSGYSKTIKSAIPTD